MILYGWSLEIGMTVHIVYCLTLVSQLAKPLYMQRPFFVVSASSERLISHHSLSNISLNDMVWVSYPAQCTRYNRLGWLSRLIMGPICIFLEQPRHSNELSVHACGMNIAWPAQGFGPSRQQHSYDLVELLP